MYEREITAINDVLTDGMLPGDITRRQLAYQMGGDEKFFEYGSDGYRLLRAMGMEDIVRRRPMPKSDLVYHAPRRRKHMRVLVTENLDPYLDVHDLMYEDGRTQILGERVHAVVLGGGTPVLEHNRLSLLLDTLGADTVEVLYWGDIDRAGVDLMMKLKAELGEKYKFSSFSPAYRLMVDRAMERFPDPADNETTSRSPAGRAGHVAGVRGALAGGGGLRARRGGGMRAHPTGDPDQARPVAAVLTPWHPTRA